MKCQKCAKPAVVHLTEIVGPSDPDADGKGKHVMEIHLCLHHAVQAGILSPSANVPDDSRENATAEMAEAESVLPAEKTPLSIMPASAEPSGLALTRTSRPAGDEAACPVCGMTWSKFKQGGLMGCEHDYEQFGDKLLPLLRRAQENASQHVGKVPTRHKSAESDRQITSVRLRRELQRALHAENYEQAARLRDQLRKIESA